MAKKTLESGTCGGGDRPDGVGDVPAKAAVRPYRVAYLVTHPIQYQAPLLRLIAQQPDWPFRRVLKRAPGTQHMIEPGLELAGDAEVVHRRTDHNQVSRFKFLDQGF